MKAPTSLILISSLALSALGSEPLEMLSESPPSETPQKFLLPKEPNYATAERIALSKDKKVIFYSLVTGYDPGSESKIVKIDFVDGQWTPPQLVVKDYNSPALSPDESMLYIEGKNSKDAWYLEKRGSAWSSPQKFFSIESEHHYLVESNRENYFYSTLSNSKASIREFYTVPSSSPADEPQALRLAAYSYFPRDFYISPAEDFLITQVASDDDPETKEVAIYFKRGDGHWSKPITLGGGIRNIPGSWKWGFYISTDQKYFFVTSGNDISDTHIYWCLFKPMLDKAEATLRQ
ncbi:MAG: hypothetical protein AAGB46_04415 [Verrucomicrobiota bacterium]